MSRSHNPLNRLIENYSLVGVYFGQDRNSDTNTISFYINSKDLSAKCVGWYFYNVYMYIVNSLKLCFI